MHLQNHDDFIAHQLKTMDGSLQLSILKTSLAFNVSNELHDCNVHHNHMSYTKRKRTLYIIILGCQ